MRASSAVALALAICVGFAAAENGNTFCERYALALFGTNSAATQKALVSAVVLRAYTGGIVNVTGTPIISFPGLANEPLNKPFFSNIPAAQFETLVDHLNRFFGLVLGCTDYAKAEPWESVNLKKIHADMAINQATMSAFLGQITKSLLSFGVPSLGNVATDEFLALEAFFNMFQRGGAAEICSNADCNKFSDYLHFMADADGFFAFGSDPREDRRKMLANGYVHFDLADGDNIVQTATEESIAPLTGGLTSGAADASKRSYTVKLTTPGLYYFYSDKAKATRRAIVEVLSDDSAAFALKSGLLPTLLAAALSAVFWVAR